MVLSLRNRLKILIYVGAAVVLVMSLVDEGPDPGLTVKRLSVLEGVLFVGISFFERYLWRWWKVPTWFRTGPVLRGTWKGVVRPSDEDAQEIEAYLSIRQTYSGIGFRLMTNESTSESTTAQLTHASEGLGVAEYSFQNNPRDSVLNRSRIHYGAARLEAVGPFPDHLEGGYFTSRKTSGEMEFDTHKPTVTHSFKQASALFN